ncbi:45682_t:CDS:1, partial [Gigaspora margarita]
MALFNESYPILKLNLSHTKKILIMSLIQQLISMSIMVEGKTKLFIKSFQDCFISTFKYNRKIDVLELESFNDFTNKVWYDDKNNRQTREDL